MSAQTLPAEISNIVVPTFQQMQQMFQIWETMHQMGILNTTVPIRQSGIVNKTSTSTSTSISNSDVAQAVGQETILPSGDKIVPLGDGKYGLIKKSNQ